MLLLFLFFLVSPLLAAKADDWCRNGQTREIPFTSNKFEKCVGNRWTTQFCQTNYFYNPTIGYCEYSFSTPTTQTCIPGTRRPNKFDNTKFFECNFYGTSWDAYSCHPSTVFDRQELRCISFTTTTQWTTPTTPTTTTPYYGPCTESGGRAGYRPDIYSCGSFYQCASGFWIQKMCPAGTVWNQAILTCDHNRGQCQPKPRPPHPTYQPTYSPTWRPTTGPYGVPTTSPSSNSF